MSEAQTTPPTYVDAILHSGLDRTPWEQLPADIQAEWHRITARLAEHDLTITGGLIWDVPWGGWQLGGMDPDDWIEAMTMD